MNEKEIAEKALRKLTAIMDDYNNGEMDKEDVHYYGDRTLIDFLNELGYDDVADAWEKLPKWYAQKGGSIGAMPMFFLDRINDIYEAESLKRKEKSYEERILEGRRQGSFHYHWKG